MQIKIKTLKGEVFPVDCDPNELVQVVKERIEGIRSEMPAAHMKLIFSGKVLENDKTLTTYNVNENDFFVIMISKPKAAKPVATPSTAPAPNPTPARAATAPISTAPAHTPAAETSPAPAPSHPAPAPAANAPRSLAIGGSELEVNVRNLCEMGFEESQAQAALRAAFGNPMRAVEYLTSGMPVPEVPSQQPHAQSADSQAPNPGNPNPPAVNPAATPMGAMGGALPWGANAPMPQGGGGGGVPAGLQGLDLQQLMQNPALMQQLMESPEVQQMMQSPEFQQVLQNQALLQQLLQMDPAMMQAIQNNPQIPQQAMNNQLFNPAALGRGGGGPPPPAIELSIEDNAAIERLEGLGFDRNECIQAFLACDKNENLAANFLFDSNMGP